MPDLTDNPALGRFEMDVDGGTAFVAYRREPGRLVLVHTEVPDSLSGRGVGSALARSVLARARERHERVVPECEFIAAFMRRHAEYSDLLADGDGT